MAKGFEVDPEGNWIQGNFGSWERSPLARHASVQPEGVVFGGKWERRCYVCRLELRADYYLNLLAAHLRWTRDEILTQGIINAKLF